MGPPLPPKASFGPWGDPDYIEIATLGRNDLWHIMCVCHGFQFLSPEHLRKHHEREVMRDDHEESMYERLLREHRAESARDSLVAELLEGKPFAAINATPEIWELAAKRLKDVKPVPARAEVVKPWWFWPAVRLNIVLWSGLAIFYIFFG